MYKLTLESVKVLIQTLMKIPYQGYVYNYN